VPTHTLLDALRRQNRQLRADIATTRWLQRHHVDEPDLRPFSHLDELQATVHDRGTPNETVDGVFAALLRVHHAGDTIAGQIIVGLLLPAVARHRRHGPGSDDHLAQLVTELWHGICRYPLDRRPRAIPANLILDARQRATRALRDPLTTTALPDVIPQLDGTRPYRQVDDRADLRTAIRRSRLTDHDLALINATRLAGIRITDLATGRDVDRLRQRRRRAEARLRTQLPA
jgi:hypothetical protein